MEEFDRLMEQYYPQNVVKMVEFLNLITEELGDISKIAGLLTEDALKRDISADWKGLPHLSPNEIIWAHPETRATEETIGEAAGRTQLERFLSKIAPGETDIAVKLKKLELAFNGQFNELGMDLSNKNESVGKILGYLMFFKTLTHILQSFNAASAGFTFEAFLATLLGGQQIPATEADTIADFLDSDGTPISLKLLDEKSASVEGSFRQLVDDFLPPNGRAYKAGSMQYIVCLKQITGKGRDISGQIKFYRFYFTLDSFLRYITAGSPKTLQNIRLPLSAEGVIDLERKMGLSTDDDLLPFIVYASEKAEALVDEALASVTMIEDKEAAKNLLLAPFMNMSSFGGENAPLNPLSKDRKKVSTQAPIKWFKKIDAEAAAQHGIAWTGRGSPQTRGEVLQLQKTIYGVLIEGYISVVQQFWDEHQGLVTAASKEGNYASYEDSLSYLQELQSSNPEQFFPALSRSYGYVTERQWVLSRQAVEATSAEAGAEGKAYLGRIFIGQNNLAEMINRCAHHIDEKMFEIFRSLKILTNLLHEFFVGGLKQTVGKQAVQQTVEIEGKTKTFIDLEKPQEEI
jgi:hypothetical protein